MNATCQNEPLCGCAEAEQTCALTQRDVIGLLRNLERQGEDNIWRTAQEAREEIERLRGIVSKARHWALHAMLMRSTQNEELLRILRGEAPSRLSGSATASPKIGD